MNHDDHLYLYEQLMLLMLRDDSGRMESHTENYQLALGGALLADLMLAGTIRIDSGDKREVRVVETKHPRDPLLRECIDLVSDHKRPLAAADWVSHFGGLKRLRHRVAEGLCRRGILKVDAEQVLFFFTRAVYPTIDAEPEQHLVERLREAVLGNAREIDSDISLLVALAKATDLLRIHFGKAELEVRERRIEEIARGELAGSVTAAAVQAAAEAAQAAVMSAIIASTVIYSATYS